MNGIAGQFPPSGERLVCPKLLVIFRDFYAIQSFEVILRPSERRRVESIGDVQKGGITYPMFSALL